MTICFRLFYFLKRNGEREKGVNLMDQDKIVQDLFRSVELIAEKKVNELDAPQVIVGTIIERLNNSDSYSVSYLNTEITASSLGGLYNKGDEVFILLPSGLNKTKFILGKTNNRTPTFTFNGEGLSEKDLALLQGIINEIQDLSSDNVISPIEKQTLQVQWQNILNSYNEVMELVRPYTDTIDTSQLTESFNSLRRLFTTILANMDVSTPIDGESFRNAVAGYLSLDKDIRLAVQAALREELTYKVQIFSSNGESFKNSVIDTMLSAVVMRGKKIITDTIGSPNIIWRKLDGMGGEIPGWIRTGRSISINQDDVDGKQIFQVSIQVDEAIVAKDIVTIVDLNDIGNISLSATTSKNKTQVYNPKTGKFTPDYSVDNQEITITAAYGGEDITLDSVFTWFHNDQEITLSDDKFTLNNNRLVIKKNLMNTTDIPSMKIKANVRYYNPDYKVDVNNIIEIDFSCVQDGETPILAQIIAPKGTVIKNEGVDLSATTILRQGNTLLTPSSIRWFSSEDSEKWTEIPLTRNLNTIAILRETINGTLHVKSEAYYKDDIYQSAVISFADLLDTVNPVIIGSGLFRDNGANTYTADIYLGQELLTDPEQYYDIVWSITNQRMRASLFNGDWPKRGKTITVNASEIPDNPGIALILNVFKKE